MNAAGDLTWGPGAAGLVWMLGFPAFAVLAVALAVSAVSQDGNRGAWYAWVWLAFVVLVAVLLLVEVLRTAYRVTLRRDGTLELVRPIGTVLVRLDQVSAVRFRRFDPNRRSYAVQLCTGRGTYLVLRRIDDLGELVEALRDRDPRIEPPSGLI